MFRKALAINPRYVKALCGLAAALNDEERFEEAEEQMQEALRAAPREVDLLIQYAALLRNRKEGDKALEVLRRAAARDPVNAAIQLSLRNLLTEAKDPAMALDHFEQVLRLEPESREAFVNRTNLKASICQWQGRDEEIGRLIDMVREADAEESVGPLPPFAPISFLLSQEEKLGVYRRWASKLSERVRERRDWLAKLSDSSPIGSETKSSKTSPIRIGYLSSDFRDHAVSHLMQGMLGLHDRDEFEVFCFSFGPDDGSVYRKRAESDCDHFRDLWNQPYWAIAETIARDRIDILMDLNGYAAGCRPKIVALRPAPLQISFVGYPGTMGADFIDYLVVDRIVVPPGMETFYSEKLVFMPHSWLISDREQAISEHRMTRAEYGLPEEGFVYCCFNSNYKIEPKVFEVWIRIMEAVPGSVLWLHEGSPAAADNLRSEAEARGVDPERLIFVRRLPEKAEHLARHRLADLVLDTLIYNAITTASDALWAGLPLITCPGQTFESRVAASFLTAVGLPELIMPDLETYQETAILLAREPNELKKVKEKLAANRTSTPLFDTPRWVRNWEKALRMIWERYESGEAPAEIEIKE